MRRVANARRKAACGAGTLAVLSSATLVWFAATTGPVDAATGRACPAGSQPFDFFWQRADGTGAVWPQPYANSTVTNTGYSLTYPVGAGVSLSATITDPQNRNEDGDSPLVANAAPVVANWDTPFYTKTNGAYGADYLTVVMGSVSEEETVTLEFSFTKPVLIPEFDIGDVDYSGQFAPRNDPLHDSFQDEVELFAERGGAPVGFTFEQGSPATNEPLITGPSRVAGGPFDPAVNGNLNPTDLRGTVYLRANAPVTSFGLNYSNGPDDAANDPPAADGIPNVPAGSTGVSNNHAIRISSFTVCVGTLSIGDTVYADLDGDGTRDPGEPGLPDVSIELRDDAGNVIGTTTTDANGNYSFTQLPPNLVYTVDVDESTLPGGTTWTPTDDRDADEDGATPVDFTGPNPTSVTDANFGYQPTPSTISGRVVSDPNNDGVFNGFDTGIGGVTVELLDSAGVVVGTTVTDSDGNYSFTNLAPGTYSVREVQPTGFTDGIDRPGTNGATNPSNDQHTVTLAYGQSSTDNDFYEVPQASLSGTVWHDVDNDGVQDAGEPGIAGTTVTLTGVDEDGNAVTRVATTDASGNYSFSGLRAGTYTVTETQPAGFLDGSDSRPATPGGTLGNDTVSNITLGRTTNAVDYDFGEVVPATISGNVSSIATTSGPIAGVTMTLSGTDDRGNPVSVVTTTDASGNYSFTGLRPGTYTVTETQPTDYGTVGQTSPDPAAITSDTNVISNIVLSSGEVNANNNFTERLGSIAGTVYVDVDDDGVIDNGEARLPSVEVRLFDGPTLVATTLTDANGNYFFGDLPPGTYRVLESQPATYADGRETVGSLGGGTPSNDEFDNIELPAGGVGTGYNFGELEATSISGRVTDDSGAPIAGVTIRLFDSQGDEIGSVLTDANGQYSFTGLAPGTYSLTETQPAGYGEGTTSPGSAGGSATGNTISGIVLTSGQAGVNYDFVETLSSLAGTVFDDLDNDGVQDAGEPGISGVTVRLTGTDAGGNTVERTLTTDENGEYVFDDLRGGSYTVTETQPSAFLDGTDSRPASPGGTLGDDVVSAIALPGGVDAVDYDFGEIRPGSISGTVTDENGEPISGVTITLTGTDDRGNSVSVVTTTDANGDYVFTDLRPGTYTVTETQPAGYGEGGQTSDDPAAVTTTTNVISNIVLSSGETNANNDFVETYSSLSGFVYVDLDNDGVRDSGEPGLGGVNVTLTGLDASGATINISATTDANGRYLFTDLLAGTYTVTETQPSRYADGRDTPGSVGGVATNDVISTITLPANTDAVNYNFGERGTTLSGSVWVDTDRDGVRDAGETTGVGNVLITLVDADGNVVATTTTGPDGSYSFPGIPAGDYVVRQTQPSGYGSSTPNSLPVTVPLTGLTNVNFGETLGSIGDRVWSDADGDGVQDAGEPGVGGVTVLLLDTSGNEVDRVTTNADGSYRFDNVPFGEYVVEFELPEGRSFTESGAGTAATGSDPDWTTGRTPTVSVSATAPVITDIDAGLVPTVIDLEISGTVTPSETQPGGTVTFTFNPVNNSEVPILDGVLIEFSLPPGLSNPVIVAPGYSCTITGSTATCVRPGVLLPGAALPPISISGRVTGSGALTVEATIGTLDGNPETTFSNNGAALSVRVRGGTLPRTGRSVDTTLALASGFVLVGALLARRRRRLA